MIPAWKTCWGLALWLTALAIWTTICSAEPPEDIALRERFAKFDRLEADRQTVRHMHGLVRAMHAYHEAHATFPPAVVPNDDLPPEKRLSGLVLLLPHLEVDSWLDRKEPCFDAVTVKLAKETYSRIDLSRAWDDPRNQAAARTLIPAFLSPTSGPFRDAQGFAVTHFGLVRGSEQSDDGAFPGTQTATIADIQDGTVSTFALGQLARNLGPWIAAGPSTSRRVALPIEGRPAPFGAQADHPCHFAFCDSTVRRIRLNKIERETLNAFATRGGGELVEFAFEP